VTEEIRACRKRVYRLKEPFVQSINSGCSYWLTALLSKHFELFSAQVTSSGSWLASNYSEVRGQVK
jgi:hypothetical protein